jgi:hypothetical protein
MGAASFEGIGEKFNPVGIGMRSDAGSLGLF